MAINGALLSIMTIFAGLLCICMHYVSLNCEMEITIVKQQFFKITTFGIAFFLQYHGSVYYRPQVCSFTSSDFCDQVEKRRRSLLLAINGALLSIMTIFAGLLCICMHYVSLNCEMEITIVKQQFFKITTFGIAFFLRYHGSVYYRPQVCSFTSTDFCDKVEKRKRRLLLAINGA